MAAGKAYFEAVAANPQHAHGPPHPRVALAAMDAVAAEEGEAFKKAARELEQMGPSMIAQVILHFQVKRCHPEGKNAGTSKVIVAISPIASCEILGQSPGGPRLYALIEKMFTRIAKERQVGSPPKNQLERTLARMLTSIGNSAGGEDDMEI